MRITKKYIKEGQYKTTEYLQTRIDLHTLFSNYSFHSWVCSKLPITRPARVLQVACGTGQFMAENYYKFPVGSTFVLTDISEAMIRLCEERLHFMRSTEFQVCDFETLPFPNESFDIVLAHHCMYHADHEKSLPELKRVSKSDGFVSVTTNGASHMLNVFELGIRLSPQFPRDRHIDTFVEEKADKILAKHFPKVRKYVSTDVLKVTDASFVRGFIRSEIEARQTGLGEDFYEQYTREVDQVIREKYFYEIPKKSPLYVCGR